MDRMKMVCVRAATIGWAGALSSAAVLQAISDNPEVRVEQRTVLVGNVTPARCGVYSYLPSLLPACIPASCAIPDT